SPFLDGPRLPRAFPRRAAPGVVFRAAAFQPAFHKYQGRLCHGVQVHVTDRARFRPFATYLTLIAEARRQAPRQFRWRRPPYEFETRRWPIDLLCGGVTIRRALEHGVNIERLEHTWRRDVARFARDRRPYLLYELARD